MQKIIESSYHYQPAWVLAVIILGIMITGYLYSAFYNQLTDFVRALGNSRIAERLSVEGRAVSNPVSVLLSVNFILIISLFILQLTSSGFFAKYHVKFSFVSFLLIAVTVFLVYLVKILFIKILGFIFDKKEIVEKYIFTVFLVNQMLGLVFIPFVIFIAYSTQSKIFGVENGLIYFGIIVLLLGFIVRIWKGVVSVWATEKYWFYLFLYICTLEILPLLAGIKLVSGRM
jgi:hypothetical protein